LPAKDRETGNGTLVTNGKGGGLPTVCFRLRCRRPLGGTTMRLKQLFLMPALLAATPAPAPPPLSLTPYISNGRFDPGDYRWLRGQFADASEADRTASNAIEDWKRRCTAASVAEVRTELAALGVNPGESLNTIAARNPICSEVSSSPWPLETSRTGRDLFTMCRSSDRSRRRTFLRSRLPR